MLFATAGYEGAFPLMRVLLIGGYGFFGDKLCTLLADQAHLKLIIAGRNLDQAKAACVKFKYANATFETLKLDRNQDLSAQLSGQRFDVIIDISGPFQTYGDTPYRVVEYALFIGAHYFDIADGSEFVSDIRDFDAQAKVASLAIISGVSTYPALTSSVLSRLSGDMDIVTHMRAGISPSPHTGMGRSVVDAIASYAGKKFITLQDGKPQTAYGLTDSVTRRICPPGIEPLDRLPFSNVDVPDGRLFGDSYDGLQSVWNGAGPKPAFLHRCLMGLSWLVRLRLLPGLRWLSPLFHFCMIHMASGPHRGGMFVEVSGLTNGKLQTQIWNLIAESDAGPLIPVIPLAILVRKALIRNWPAPGARPCIDEVTLADYETEFAKHNIHTGIHSDPTPEKSLYENLLGAAYKKLPTPIQDLHRNDTITAYSGMATIERGRNPISQLTGSIFRFPKAGHDIPVRVSFTTNNGVETWERNFGGRIMRSTQELGQGRYERLMVERFGPFAIGIALIVKNGRLYNVTESWSVFGIPLPKVLVPGGEVFEHDADGRFNFHVEIKAPLLGLLVRYKGYLERDEAALAGVTGVADISAET